MNWLLGSDGVLDWCLLKIQTLPWKKNKKKQRKKTKQSHRPRHTDTQTLTQRGMNSSKTVFLSLFLPLSLRLSHTHAHTYTFMTANWISSVWRQGLLLWRRQVFRRGDGHRKEGRILSTRSFPLWVSLLLPDKRDRWKKTRGGDGDRKQEPLQWQVLCRRSDRSFLSFIRPLPLPVSPPPHTFLSFPFHPFILPTPSILLLSHLALSRLPPPPSSALYPNTGEAK